MNFTSTTSPGYHKYYCLKQRKAFKVSQLIKYIEEIIVQVVRRCNKNVMLIFK